LGVWISLDLYNKVLFCSTTNLESPDVVDNALDLAARNITLFPGAVVSWGRCSAPLKFQILHGLRI
jgi:hypothetical protein